jgi:hypothetical protein
MLFNLINILERNPYPLKTKGRFPKDAWWDANRAKPCGKWIQSGRMQLNKIISTRDISRLNIYQKDRLRFTRKIGEDWDEDHTLVGTSFILQGRLIKVRISCNLDYLELLV